MVPTFQECGYNQLCSIVTFTREGGGGGGELFYPKVRVYLVLVQCCD